MAPPENEEYVGVAVFTFRVKASSDEAAEQAVRKKAYAKNDDAANDDMELSSHVAVESGDSFSLMTPP